MLTIQEIERMPIVFIIGKGRSGTSLLQTIFDASPEAITANESPLILHLKQKYFHVTEWTSEKIEEFIIDLYKDKKFALLWKIDADIVRERLKQYHGNDLTFAILCKLIYLCISSPFPKSNISLIVDKNPNYSFFINELLEVFPDAKFIHLIRDYRDNVISSRKAFKIKDVSILAQRWKRQNKYINKQKKRNPAIFYTLYYEKLVTDPEVYVSEVCTYTGIPFHASMLSFHKTTTKIYNKEAPVNTIMANLVQSIHTNLLNPINTKQINKWKKELTPSEIELIDYITGNYARQHGYVPTTHTMKLYFILYSIKSNLKFWLNFSIYKIYFRVPLRLRDALRSLSRKLYLKYGYTNRYNKIDAMYQND
jgi:hypothetical protein